MARKPAQTAKPESDEKPHDDVAQENTEGAKSADHTADAPQAPADDGQGQTGGEDQTDLSAGDDATAALLEAVAGGSNEQPPFIPAAADIDFTPPDDVWIVICHRNEGRRRAGRRWAHGRTPVRRGELTSFELAQLHADPLFTVVSADVI